MACKATDPMSGGMLFLLRLVLAVLSTESGRTTGGGKRGGLMGTAAATACKDSSILATRFPSLIRAMRSSSLGSTVGTACQRLPGAIDRVVGRALFGTGARLEYPGPDSRATDLNVTPCLERERPAAKAAFEVPVLADVARNVPNC